MYVMMKVGKVVFPRVRSKYFKIPPHMRLYVRTLENSKNLMLQHFFGAFSFTTCMDEGLLSKFIYIYIFIYKYIYIIVYALGRKYAAHHKELKKTTNLAQS